VFFLHCSASNQPPTDNSGSMQPVSKAIQEVDSSVSKKRVGNTDSAQMLGNELEGINRDDIATIRSSTDQMRSHGASNYYNSLIVIPLEDNDGAPIDQESYSEGSLAGSFGDDIPLLKLNEHSHPYGRLHKHHKKN